MRARHAALSAALVGLVLATGACSSGRPEAPPDPAAVASVFRVADSGRCPTWRSSFDLTGNVPGRTRHMVPFPATRLLLCGYHHGQDGMAPEPATALVTDRAAIQRLTKALDAVRKPKPGTYHCGEDTGAEVLEIFTGSHAHERAEAEVLQSLSGCPGADNGYRDGWVGESGAGTAVMELLPRAYQAMV
ncbi:MAG: hypothetical protein FWE75_10770 [Actinomycetia bacterium]|nr:hypothetical protein [Actinomycetes bacterium]